MLVCINCARVVDFESGDWVHRQDNEECTQLVVAWPPPGTADSDVAPGAVA